MKNTSILLPVMVFGEEPDRVPDKLREQIFEKLFETAEIARFTPEQIRSCEDSLKYYRDLKNSLDTAREEGREEGREKGILAGIEQVALNMIRKGLPAELIAETTGLTVNQIETLKNHNK